MEHRRSGRPLSIEITGLNAGSGPELRRLYLFCFLALSAAGTCTVAIQNSEITPSNEPLSLSPPIPYRHLFKGIPKWFLGQVFCLEAWGTRANKPHIPQKREVC